MIMINFICNIMSKRHRNKNKKDFVRPSYICDKNKFVIKQEREGKYSIYYIDSDIKICILTYEDDDDEYCKNNIIETLDFIQRDI